MNVSEIEKLIHILRANNVSRFKSGDIELRFNSEEVPLSFAQKPKPTQKATTKTAASAPPADIEIPHHVNEVKNLLRLADEDLVEKLFPDYSDLKGQA